MHGLRVLAGIAVCAAFAADCRRGEAGSTDPSASSESTHSSAPAPTRYRPFAPTSAPTPPLPPPPSERVIRFAWTPPGGDAAAYAMEDAEDRHRIVLFGIGDAAHDVPVVIALHGQPRRGQAPRTYAFLASVIEEARASVARGDVRPFALALPVFRFLGTDWPRFDLVEFRAELGQILATEHVTPGAFYVIGHSGAAGCGGDGLNRAHRMRPAAVAFVDTCVGDGWAREILDLRAAHVPTLVVHSVETAGFRPRPAREYLTDFDFGKVDAPLGLVPGACPERQPSVPLRAQRFRCSSDPTGTTRGFVIDSGSGEAGHNAAVPVALAYFLREYVGRLASR